MDRADDAVEGKRTEHSTSSSERPRSVASQHVSTQTAARSPTLEPQPDDRLDISVAELRNILGNTAQAQRVIALGKTRIGQQQRDIDRFNNPLSHQAESIDSYIESRLNRNGPVTDYFNKLVDHKVREWQDTQQTTTLDAVDAAIQARPDIVTSLFRETKYRPAVKSRRSSNA